MVAGAAIAPPMRSPAMPHAFDSVRTTMASGEARTRSTQSSSANSM
jgi:hypothetical protein